MDWNSVENNLEQVIKRAQYLMQQTLKQWATMHNLTTIDGTHWYHGTALVVVADNELRRGVITLFHDHKAAGLLGITKTLQLIAPYYWWPNMKTFVTEYIKGCTSCQMSKINRNPVHPPLFPISPAKNAHCYDPRTCRAPIFISLAPSFLINPSRPPSFRFPPTFTYLQHWSVDVHLCTINSPSPSFLFRLPGSI